MNNSMLQVTSAQSRLPALVAAAGDRASMRFLEFFAIPAHALALWASAGVPSIGAAADARRHLDEAGTRALAAPSVKQSLAAIRHLFDWLAPVRASHPAGSVRGPRHVVTSGQTPVLDPAEARALLYNIDVSTHAGLGDRALLGLMVYSFPGSARRSAWWSRLSIHRTVGSGCGCVRKAASGMRCRVTTISRNT